MSFCDVSVREILNDYTGLYCSKPVCVKLLVLMCDVHVCAYMHVRERERARDLMCDVHV